MDEPKLIYLIMYAVAMVWLSIRAVRKHKSFMYCCLWIAYAVSAVMCVLCKIFQPTLVGTGVMHNKWYDLSDTTLRGYALIVICCLIAFKPFDLFDKCSNFEQLGKGEGRPKKQFYRLFTVAYILMALIFILLSISTIKGLLGTSDFGLLRSKLYGNSENESDFVMTTNFVANFCYKMCLQFKFLNVFIALSMVKDKYKTYLAIISLVMTFLVYYLYATGNAARGGLLIFTFCAALVGCTLLKYMSPSSKRKILIVGGVGLAVVLSFFITVTVSRFGNDHGGGNPILRNISFYLGHGPIEFSKITGSLREFAYGKTIIGRLGNHYFGMDYSWEQIQSQIGYPAIGPVFITYLGYMYTDFGSIGCIVFVSLWSWFMCKLIRKSPNRISTVFLYFYYLSYFVTGIFAVGRLEYAAMITAHVIFFIIRFAEDFLRLRSRPTRFVYGNGFYRRM